MARAMVHGALAALLFLNLVVGALLPPRPVAAAELGQRLEICTAAGMVAVDASGRVSPAAGSRAGHDGLCVFCLPLFHAAGTAPMAGVVLDAPMPPETVAFAALSAIPVAVLRPAGTIGPRAPPVS